MKKTNTKGFTLIELLAVITIMGILMIVAIPAVTRTIENSRKDTFIDTVKQYVNGAKNMWAADNLSCQATDGSFVSSAVPAGTYYIKVDSNSSSVPQLLEQGGKSPWGSRDMKGYIQVVVEDNYGLYGDINHDGVINVTDLCRSYAHASKITEWNASNNKYDGRIDCSTVSLGSLTEFEMILADVNGDGTIGPRDTLAILQYVEKGKPIELNGSYSVSYRNIKYYPVISDGVHGVNLVASGSSSVANTTLTASEDLKRGSITMSGMTYYTPSLTNICVES